MENFVRGLSWNDLEELATMQSPVRIALAIKLATLYIKECRESGTANRDFFLDRFREEGGEDPSAHDLERFDTLLMRVETSFAPAAPS